MEPAKIPAKYGRSRFTVRLAPKLKTLLIQEVARRNSLGGMQITQSTLVQEIIEEGLVMRGLLKRD